MLRKIKFKNSTILFAGILIILIGISIGLSEYFIERKSKAYSDMNILLYENELPKNIDESINIVTPESQISEQEQSINEDKQEEQKKEENKPVQHNYIGILEIPKINLKRGFYDLNYRYNHVDYNITVIKGSTFPNVENNNLILAAHSGECAVCFFDKLYKLSKGDIAYLTYNNVKYTYKIVDIYEVEKDGTVAIYRDYTKKTLTLITCTRNSDTKQTVYILEQQN